MGERAASRWASCLFDDHVCIRVERYILHFQYHESGSRRGGEGSRRPFDQVALLKPLQGYSLRREMETGAIPQTSTQPIVFAIVFWFLNGVATHDGRVPVVVVRFVGGEIDFAEEPVGRVNSVSLCEAVVGNEFGDRDERTSARDV